MKRFISFSIFPLFMVLLFAACSVEKRMYLPGFHVEWNQKKEAGSGSGFISERASNSPVYHNQSAALLASAEKSNCIPGEKHSVFISKRFHPEKKKNRIHTQSGDTCDNIILVNGDEIPGKIIKIGVTEIEYLRCDYLDGPTIVLKKSDVFMIKYGNGSKEVISPVSNNDKSRIKNYEERKLETFSIISFVLGLLGAAILIGSPAAIILGIIGLNRIKKNPDIYKGKAYAIIGITLGAVFTCFLIYALFFFF